MCATPPPAANLRFNAQPLTTRTNKGILGLAHNGNFVNAREVRNQMLMEGALFATTNDSEVMLNLIARESHMDLVEATAGAMQQLRGGYACVLMSRTALIGFRDPNGVRPLVIGQRDTATAVRRGVCDRLGAVRPVRGGSTAATRRAARRTRLGGSATACTA